MGKIYDRTKEHLGSSDTAIIHARRLWLNAARQWQDGRVTPRGVDVPDAYYLRSLSVVLPHSTVWTDAAHELAPVVEGRLLEAP